IVKDGSARLENGALAGSILTLNKAIKNIYENTDYPLYEIVKMASFNGAKYCRVDDKKGQIKENFDADLVLFDDNIDIKMTIVNGKIVYSS
ncbi:amidohydrolase family protein, partial [Clostridioides difficile]